MYVLACLYVVYISLHKKRSQSSIKDNGVEIIIDNRIMYEEITIIRRLRVRIDTIYKVKLYRAHLAN